MLKAAFHVEYSVPMINSTGISKSITLISPATAQPALQPFHPLF